VALKNSTNASQIESHHPKPRKSFTQRDLTPVAEINGVEIFNALSLAQPVARE